MTEHGHCYWCGRVVATTAEGAPHANGGLPVAIVVQARPVVVACSAECFDGIRAARA